ncbi:hypothetical protein [Bacillus sp. FJAT-53060]|uniref:hypothetical protein n=1 Tax=Bacillus sp. FJAT-53060 TaxID=3127666 RepID=UPI003FA567D2
MPWVFAVMTFAGSLSATFSALKAYGHASIAFDFNVYDFACVDASLRLVSGASTICG